MRLAAAVAMVPLSIFWTAAPLANAETPVDEFVRTVNMAAERYHTGPIPVTVQPLADENTFAMTVGRKIVFNSSYANDPLRLFSAIQHNVNAGWIPPGCTPAITVALHEVAHVIDNVRGRLGSRRVAAAFPQGNALRGEVSRYSFGQNNVFNAEEAVASAFQSVLCNGGTDVEIDMYYMLVQP